MGRSSSSAVGVATALACAALAIACNMINGSEDLAIDDGESEQSITPGSSGGGTSGGASSGSSGASSSGASSSGHGGGPPLDAGEAGPADAAALDSGLPPASTFFDDFARPDGAIGNGWLPKVGKFSLSSGAVKAADSSLSYKDLLVRRPASEAALDVEIAVDATLPPDGGDVGLYARIQPASDQSDVLVAYTFYPGSENAAYVDHDIGKDDSLPITSFALNPPIAGGQTIHMKLRVTGTSPVHIVASISDAGGKLLGSASVDDNTPNPIVTAGQVGFGSGGGGSRFDDFAATKF
jgi:hypothetical protein